MQPANALMNIQPAARRTLLLILLPMLATFAGQRLFLHLVGVHHVRAGGLIIHHLFFGVAMLIPAAFVLAFPIRSRTVANFARVALGIGSAMVLDEVVYLVATEARDGDYLSPLSLWGAILLISLAVLLLMLLFRLSRNKEKPGEN